MVELSRIENAHNSCITPISHDKLLNEGGDESETDPLTAQVDFLSQVPPNWEAAEKHGLASLVNNPKAIDIVKAERCQCC